MEGRQGGGCSPGTLPPPTSCPSLTRHHSYLLLRAFFGLANQLSSSTAILATTFAPLSPLLSTKNEFIWTPDLEVAFSTAKQTLSSAPVLSYFDLIKPTRLCTDASRQGLSFVLQQKNGDDWTLIQAGSRFLSPAESRYAIIELELLAVSWAITKCNIFLAGLPHFTVITDHHPLIPILNTHRLDEIENPRLQRLKNRIMAYNFTTQWIKGTLNNAPDALSRNPVSSPSPQELIAEYDHHHNPEPSITEVRATSTGTNCNLHLQELSKHAKEDQTYQKLTHYIRNGFPDHRNQLPEQCRPFWNVRSQLTLDDSLIVHGYRLLIPQALRSQTLQELYSSYQGVLRTKLRAKLIVYWPGINNDIENTTFSCKQCQSNLPSQPRQPLVTKPRPPRPFQKIAVDFCSHAGHEFLIIVDCHTDWPDIIHMGHNTSAPQLIKTLLGVFCRTGAPDIVWSDQGPQFTSKLFADFAKEWGFHHTMSSPRYPQSNGKAEATVKSMKKIIRAAWRCNHLDQHTLTRALIQYRNTPSLRDQLSPAQKLYGKPIQDALPAHRLAFSPQWQKSSEETEKKAVNKAKQTESYYNQHVRELPEIRVGTKVAIQDSATRQWDIYGTVTAIGPHRRYFVKTMSGRVLVRNRRFLLRQMPLTPPTSITPSLHHQPTLPNRAPPTAPPPWRSARQRTRTSCLIEEIAFT